MITRNQSTWRKTCPSTTLCITSAIWIRLGIILVLQG